uniref:C2H2-type domain-containing protein n=1 Tax=Globodera rostochiensis TaxID=31243 RepID=A0A914I0D3_GLORO
MGRPKDANSGMWSTKMLPNINNNLIRCQICVNVNGCPPADAARLFSAEDLLLHIYAHLNYRPHKCSQCDFAAISPSELVQHSQQSMHYHLTLYNAENTFLKELCQHILDKCRQWNNLASHPFTVALSDRQLPIKRNESADNAQCSSQSASPIPSLNSSINRREEQKQQPMDTSDEGSTIVQSFAEQLNALTEPNNAGLSLSFPKQQNFYAIEKAFHDCVRGVSEVFASVPGGAKTNGCGAPTQNHLDATQNVSTWASQQQKIRACESHQQMIDSSPFSNNIALKCVLCGHVTKSNIMRDYHCNTHLGLLLFRCRICSSDFAKYNNWRKHLYERHRLTKQKFVRVEENWEKLRISTKTMFVPVGSTAGNTQPTSSSSTLATAAVGTNSTSNVPPPSRWMTRPSTVCPQLYPRKSRISKRNPLCQDNRTCAECDEFLPNTDASRLHHTNVKHLNLCLYMCPLCNKEFMSTINGFGFCILHIKTQHPRVLLPSKKEVSLADLPGKMSKIRARAAELFALDEQ